MSFKTELLKAKSKNDDLKGIKQLLDNGLIQEHEIIDGIHYITFAFSLSKQQIYNYCYSDFRFDFSVCELADVIYVGGIALDDYYNILKGIIYPYYTKIYTKDEYNMFGDETTSLLPYINGIPQIINKSNKLKLNDLFIEGKYFKLFNLITDNTDTWAKFALGKETYLNTNIVRYENGYDAEPDKFNDITFFGDVKNIKDNTICYIKKYKSSFAKASNSIPISFVEKKLKLNSIQSSIATKIFCTNSSNKAKIKSAEIQKEGMNNIGASIVMAGSDIRAGASNIANALNKNPDVVRYF